MLFIFSLACVTACLCDFVGTESCNPANGDCTCKPGVASPLCDKCMLGYWGFSEYGCRPCHCAGDCDPYTGDCMTGLVCVFACVFMNRNL